MARTGQILSAAGLTFGVLGLALAHKARAQGSVRHGDHEKFSQTPPAPLYPSGVPVADMDYTPASWLPIVTRIIMAEYPRVNLPFAMKWLTIESGGNPSSVGNPGQLGQGSDQPAEIGLGQLYNPDDFVHLHAPPAASFRAYAPAAAPLAAEYRQAMMDVAAAQKQGDVAAATAARARMASAARRMQSRTRPLTADEQDQQVRWTLLAKIADSMAIADKAVATYSLAHWSVPDYWKLVKAPHALPGILNQGMPAVVKKLGHAPASWGEFRAALGMEGNAQWKRALDACETCGNAVAPTVA